eukprot:783171-Pelagomonas_calceolata.AAC.4
MELAKPACSLCHCGWLRGSPPPISVVWVQKCWSKLVPVLVWTDKLVGSVFALCLQAGKQMLAVGVGKQMLAVGVGIEDHNIIIDYGRQADAGCGGGHRGPFWEGASGHRGRARDWLRKGHGHGRFPDQAPIVDRRTC